MKEPLRFHKPWEPKFPLDIQFFAGEPGNPGNQDPGTPGAPGTPGEPPKSFTPEEVQAQLAAATEKLNKEWQDKLNETINKKYAQFQQKLEAEKAEAERLAKMNADERAKAEFEKAKAEFETQKAEFAKKELIATTKSIFAEEKLPVALADFIVGTDAETTQTNITKFKEAWQKAIQDAVADKFAGASRKPGDPAAGPTGPAKYTMEQIKAMSTQEVMADFENVQKSMVYYNTKK